MADNAVILTQLNALPSSQRHQSLRNGKLIRGNFVKNCKIKYRYKIFINTLAKLGKIFRVKTEQNMKILIKIF